MLVYRCLLAHLDGGVIVMPALSTLKRLAAPLLLALALAPLLAAAPAQAQSNSREATEAARKYRAEQARGDAPAPQRSAPAASANTRPPERPFSSGANPAIDPKRSLKACLDHVGINPVARDRCMRQHCKGRWGQGDCPAGGDLMNRKGSNAATPLGRCLREAGANPFKRDACGWRHCKPRWESAECQALRPTERPMAN